VNTPIVAANDPERGVEIHAKGRQPNN